MTRIKSFISLLKESFSAFMDDNALKLSAALSYYTVFSLAPLLLLIISMVSIFFGREAFEGELFGQINGLVGKEAASQLQELIKNAAITHKSKTAAVVGIVTLVVGATGVFAEIQDSINYVWSIKSKPQKSWLEYLKNRFLSFSIIVALGFLLIVSLGVNTLVDLLSSRLEHYFPQVSVVLFSALNILIVLAIITALFTVIFKVLPDGHVRWKECLVGAAFTAVLFAIGKFGISFYLGKSDLGATYGTSASIIILLTWIYYSSIILYFGAEFTKVYAKSDGHSITPNAHAVLVERREAVQSVAEVKDAAGGVAARLHPKTLIHKVIDPVTDFIDAKLDQIRQEITEGLMKMASPVTFYGIVALIALSAAITLICLLGQLLNRWLNSDFLGYLILLGLTLILLVLAILNMRKCLAFIRNAMFSFLKQK